jgi:hypothetical protein
MATPGWVTNDPEVAKRLRAADRRYEAAKLYWRGSTLGEKVAAYRKAKEDRDAEYARIMEEISQ